MNHSVYYTKACEAEKQKRKLKKMNSTWTLRSICREEFGIYFMLCDVLFFPRKKKNISFEKCISADPEKMLVKEMSSVAMNIKKIDVF